MRVSPATTNAATSATPRGTLATRIGQNGHRCIFVTCNGPSGLIRCRQAHDIDTELYAVSTVQVRPLLGVSVDVVSVGGLKDRDVHIRREAVPI